MVPDLLPIGRQLKLPQTTDRKLGFRDRSVVEHEWFPENRHWGFLSSRPGCECRSFSRRAATTTLSRAKLWMSETHRPTFRMAFRYLNRNVLRFRREAIYSGTPPTTNGWGANYIFRGVYRIFDAEIR